MRVIRLLTMAVCVVMLVACVTSKTVVKDHAVLDVPEGAKTHRIRLAAIKSNLPRGKELGPIGIGMFCYPTGSYTATGRASLSNAEYNATFFDEFKRANYDVIGDPSDMFQDNAATADISIGGVITDMTRELCYPNATTYYVDKKMGKSKATITVEWQVYANLDKKIIYKTSTTGEASRDFTDGNADEVQYLAFSSALQGLLSDKKFRDLMIVRQAPAPSNAPGGAPDAGPGGLRDEPAGAGSMTSSGPSSAMGAMRVPLAKNDSRPLADVQKCVVVLQVGGGHGSGFLIGDEGYILTNDHVVMDLDTIRVVMSNGSKFEGRVLNRDPRQDVALVKIDGAPVKGLRPRMDDLAVGTDVFAVGAPKDMNLAGSVSKGIVSSYRMDGQVRWLQSDTTVNHGNSGGPLVDAQGRVVGICSNGRTDATNINFFVPIVQALEKTGLTAN